MAWKIFGRTIEFRFDSPKTGGNDFCISGKVDYKSKTTAENAAVAMNQKPTTRNELEAYQCWYCEGWHIGRKL